MARIDYAERREREHRNRCRMDACAERVISRRCLPVGAAPDRHGTSRATRTRHIDLMHARDGNAVHRSGARRPGSRVLGEPSDCYARNMTGEERSRKALGEFIRTQRRLANLSLRQMANLAKVSNPYLSQVERGIYKPSAEVLKSIADALHISAEAMFAKIGLIDERSPESRPDVETAIRLDPVLSDEQKEALIGVYRSF